jgi:hypothetical protein
MYRTVTILLFLLGTIQLPAADYARFEENGKIGLKDQQGAVVLPASFDALGWSDGNFSVIGQVTGFRQQGRWGLVNLKKEFITKAEFESLTYQGGDRVIVSKWISPFTMRYGCLDLAGKLVVPFMYDGISLHGLRCITMMKNGTRYEYGLIDLDNREVLPIRYQNIIPIGSLRYAVQDFNNKHALCTEEGKWMTEFTIDSISDFSFDLAITHQDWRRGVIDRNGEIKVPPVYRDIKIISPGQVSVRKADEWKILSADYNEIRRTEADELVFENDGAGHLRLNGRAGLVDENFQTLWPIEYEYIGPIENHLTVVKSNGKFGVFRMNQTCVLPAEFDSLCLDRNFVRACRRLAGASTWELYDTFGIKKTLASYEFIKPFNGKFFPVRNRGYWGAMDRYGKQILACVYDSILDVRDPMVVVKFRGEYGVVTLEDQWKVWPQRYPFKLLNDDHYLQKRDRLEYLRDFAGTDLYFTDNPIRIFPDHLLEVLPDGTEKEINFLGQIVHRQMPGDLSSSTTDQQSFRESEGYIGIKRDGKFGFVDRLGRLRIANRYDGIGEFHEGLAPVKLVGKWGFINMADQIVIQPTFDAVGNFSLGVALVSRKGKTGFINHEGKELLELRYDSVKRLPNQLFQLSLTGKKGLADTDGRILIEPRFEYLSEAANGHIIVSQNDRFGLLTRDGMSIVPLQYSKLMYIPEKRIYLAELKTEWETLELK